MADRSSATARVPRTPPRDVITGLRPPMAPDRTGRNPNAQYPLRITGGVNRDLMGDFSNQALIARLHREYAMRRAPSQDFTTTPER